MVETVADNIEDKDGDGNHNLIDDYALDSSTKAQTHMTEYPF